MCRSITVTLDDILLDRVEDDDVGSDNESDFFLFCFFCFFALYYTNSNSKKNATSRPPLGTINVIFAAPRRTGSYPSRVMSVARLSSDEGVSEPKRAKVLIQPSVGFSDEDKAGIIQPHDDALVVTLRIGGYDVRRVLVDQGNAV